MNSHHLALTMVRPVSMGVSSLSLSALQLELHRFLHPEERTTLTGIAQHYYLLGRHAAKLAAFDFTAFIALGSAFNAILTLCCRHAAIIALDGPGSPF